jgi:hypothetical protein
MTTAASSAVEKPRLLEPGTLVDHLPYDRYDWQTSGSGKSKKESCASHTPLSLQSETINAQV